MTSMSPLDHLRLMGISNSLGLPMSLPIPARALKPGSGAHRCKCGKTISANKTHCLACGKDPQCK